ncbi:asparagine synthase-related protein [Amycolatopsis sp. NPDC051128]|uniref:asparagine synthase-related protein n=1 Tax=Amycolatopsis sp. NPDC051128 TaxID=3155412 RepID=UPI00341B0BF9
MSTARRAGSLVDRLAALGPVAVAFSGGADSALVLAAAVRAAGPADVLAVTAHSAGLAAAELTAARAFAARLRVTHLTAPAAEPDQSANGRDRCSFCGATVLGTVTALARSHGIAVVATGTNADDAIGPFRPGSRAGGEAGVVTPLRDEGLRRAEVRAISRLWGLSTADKPAMPCLAGRVRYGVPVTVATLARIERAEAAVRSVLGRRGLVCRRLRVRDLGGRARVELDRPLAERLCHDTELLGVVRSQGFAEAAVTVFRSGALNHAPAGPLG